MGRATPLFRGIFQQWFNLDTKTDPRMPAGDLQSLISRFEQVRLGWGSYPELQQFFSSWLVVSNMAFIFHNILGIIIPTDELIFFKGVGQPPTR